MVAILLPIIGVAGFSIYDNVGSNGTNIESYDDIFLNDEEINYGTDVIEGDGKVKTLFSSSRMFMSPTELVELADLILLGDVKSVNVVEEKFIPDDTWDMVFTYYEIESTEILKGTPILNENGYVLLRVVGGETENNETVSEELQFTEGDHIFMYLGSHGEASPKYSPTSVTMSHIVRGDEAMNYLREIVDTSDMLDEHKVLIESLE